MKMKKLCEKLAKCDRAKEVIKILKKESYWDNPNNWEIYGNLPNNWSIIGAQQTKAITALVEKIVNLGDTVLINECILLGIDPEDIKNTPKSVRKAVEKFLNIPNGDVSTLDKRQRTNLARKMKAGVVTTGSKTHPTYTVFDQGEGQEPEHFKDTFLALAKNNKNKIPFVQGKHCSGSTGAIRFCKDGIQLIISRRNPNLKEPNASDDIGFTVTRKFPPTGNEKSYIVKYLVINGKIPSFGAKPLKILPKDGKAGRGSPYMEDWEYGSFIKMFDYDIGPTLRSRGNIDLIYAMSLLLLSPVIPIRFHERRQMGPKVSHSLENNMSGLLARLGDDLAQPNPNDHHIESSCPYGVTFHVDGQPFSAEIYVLKSGVTEYSRWHGSNGIIYSVNGQGNGFKNKSYFSTKKIGMHYIKDKIFIIVDSSSIDAVSHNELFMNNRESISDTQFSKDVQKELDRHIRSHSGLKQVLEKQRSELLNAKIANNKPVEDIMKELIKHNPVLNKLLVLGQRLSNPKNTTTGPTGSFTPNTHPTYFNLDKKSKKFSKNSPKNCERKRVVRIGMITDAPNDYFTRNVDPGKYEVELDGVVLKNRPTLSGVDGIWHLHVPTPTSQLNSVHQIKVRIDDINRPQPFRLKFWIKVVPYRKTNSTGKGKRRKGGKGKTQGPTANNLNLPPITEVYKNDKAWQRLSFSSNSALYIMPNNRQGYDYYINMDNIHLLNEMKAHKSDKDVIKQQYKMANFLMGLVFIDAHKKNTDSKEPIDDIEKFSSGVSRIYSPVMIPIMRDLELNA